MDKKYKPDLKLSIECALRRRDTVFGIIDIDNAKAISIRLYDIEEIRKIDPDTTSYLDFISDVTPEAVWFKYKKFKKRYVEEV